MTMLGSEGFEYEGEEYTVTLKFDDDGTYDGVDAVELVTNDGPGELKSPLGHNEATAIWWSLTEQQRDVLYQRCLEDAQASRQDVDNDSAWAAF